MLTPLRYRHRPTRVQAVLLTDSTWDEAMAWAGATPVTGGQQGPEGLRLPGNANPRADYWFIPARSHPAGAIVPKLGLWLVRFGDGNFRLLTPDDMDDLYAPDDA